MKEYFTQLFRRSSEEEFIEEHQEQEFEDDLCLKTIEKEFAKLSLRNKIVDSIKNFPDYMESFCKEIIDAIGNFDYAVEEHGCQFYKDNIEAIASEQDKERLQKTRHWEDVNRCISNIKQYSFENLPLISINKKNEN